MGHIITDEGIRVDQNKVKGIKDMPSPKNVKKMAFSFRDGYEFI